MPAKHAQPKDTVAGGAYFNTDVAECDILPKSIHLLRVNRTYVRS